MKKRIVKFFIFLICVTFLSVNPVNAQISKRRGWIQEEGKTYFLKNYQKIRGFRKIKGEKYFFSRLDGSMVRSRFVKIKGKYYYFKKNGKMARNRWVKGRYLGADGAMLKDAWIGDRYVDTDGKWLKDFVSPTRIEYKSSTIQLELIKHRNYNCDYWTAQIKIKSPMQLRSALSYDSYGGTRETTSDAMKRLNGILGINGSAFQYQSGRPGFDAVMIKNGHIFNHAFGTSYSVLAVHQNGTLFTPKQGLSAEELLLAGVKDTYNFGPPIIIDGITLPIMEPFGDTVSFKDPRTAIGMIKPGEYVVLVADGRSAWSRGLDYYEMAEIFQSFKCQYAYNLDGGGSSSLVYKGMLLNNPSDGTERPVGDFLYFTE